MDLDGDTGSVTIKLEAGTQGGADGGEISRQDIDVNHMDIKKECLEYSGSDEPMSEAAANTDNMSSESRPKNTKNAPKLKKNLTALTCPGCSYTCYYLSKLKRHFQTHTGSKPFSCSECSFTCSEKSTLKRHALTHSGLKPFSCFKCNFRCSCKSSLQRHILTHSEVKPFACSECSYSCTRKSRYNRHIMTHSK